MVIVHQHIEHMNFVITGDKFTRRVVDHRRRPHSAVRYFTAIRPCTDRQGPAKDPDIQPLRSVREKSADWTCAPCLTQAADERIIARQCSEVLWQKNKITAFRCLTDQVACARKIRFEMTAAHHLNQRDIQGCSGSSVATPATLSSKIATNSITGSSIVPPMRYLALLIWSIWFSNTFCASITPAPASGPVAIAL